MNGNGQAKTDVHELPTHTVLEVLVEAVQQLTEILERIERKLDTTTTYRIEHCDD